jgi:hypothetical protein
LVALALLSLTDLPGAALASANAPAGWRAYPNPFALRFRVEMPESLVPAPPNAEMQIRVFDLCGRMLRHWSFVNYGGGFIIDWDGKSDAGVTAPSGWYFFDIGFKNYPGTRGVRFKMLRIRGSLTSEYNWSWF